MDAFDYWIEDFFEIVIKFIDVHLSAILLVILALIDLRISAGLATIYLIAYAINRLRKRKPS